MSPASWNRFANLPARYSSFVASLSDEALARLYKAHGRIWLHVCNFKFHLTFGSPEDRDADSWKRKEQSEGEWVSLGILMPTHEDHPQDENSSPIDWAPDVEWVREMLLYIQDDFLTSLQYAVDRKDSRGTHRESSIAAKEGEL